MHLDSLTKKLTCKLTSTVNQFTRRVNLAVKQSSKTLRKINSSGTFALSLLTSSTVIIIVSKWVALVWRKKDFGQSIRPAGNQRNHGVLRFLTALNTSSWKDFWSKYDSRHCENSPSFQISWTKSDNFRIDEKLIHQLPAMFTCRDSKGGTLSSQASKML